MSRIGKMPVKIPKDVTVDLKSGSITVKGPKGQLNCDIHPKVNIKIENEKVVVYINEDSKESNSLHGLFRALIANMITGVSHGFQRDLEIVGVGYRAEISGKTATFSLGYSHPVVYELPEGIEGSVEKSKISLRGIDKELLGRTAAKVRGFRKPEPYKGKGIRYSDEVIKRKAGKTGAK
jgi:large subunit ribosomal protein L6